MDVYFLGGIFFLIVFILLTIRNFWIFTYKSFFWFCDFAALLLAISFFTGNFQFAKALINIGLLGQLSDWIFNMPPQISCIIKKGKKTTFKQKYRLFTEGLVHTTLPIALIMIYTIKPTLESLVYSFVIICVMFVLGILFTSKKENINALYQIELGMNENLGMINDKKKKPRVLSLPLHTYLWIFYAFLMCIPNYIIQYLLYLITAIK